LYWIAPPEFFLSRHFKINFSPLLKFRFRWNFQEVQERLASLPQSPTGIGGTTRSILAYSLIIVLGIAVFHLLTVSQGDKATDSIDKLLTLLAGSLTTAIGLYFGAKATSEGVATGIAQEPEKLAKPSGHIEKVDPAYAKHNDSVVIQSTGSISQRSCRRCHSETSRTGRRVPLQ
jgi:hypothetical protein